MILSKNIQIYLQDVQLQSKEKMVSTKNMINTMSGPTRYPS